LWLLYCVELPKTLSPKLERAHGERILAVYRKKATTLPIFPAGMTDRIGGARESGRSQMASYQRTGTKTQCEILCHHCYFGVCGGSQKQIDNDIDEIAKIKASPKIHP
jgi:hypothetical protein